MTVTSSNPAGGGSAAFWTAAIVPPFDVDRAVVDDVLSVVHRHHTAVEREGRPVERIDGRPEDVAHGVSLLGATQTSVWPSSGAGPRDLVVVPGVARAARGVVAQELRHAEREIASGDRRIVGLPERRAVVRAGRVSVGVGRDLLPQPLRRRRAIRRGASRHRGCSDAGCARPGRSACSSRGRAPSARFLRRRRRRRPIQDGRRRRTGCATPSGPGPPGARRPPSPSSGAGRTGRR